MQQIIIILFFVSVLGFPQFQIPLPFGSINVGKRDDGKVEVGLNQEANFFGYGSKGNFKVTSGNGTFETESNTGAIVNGSDYTGGGKIGFDKEKGVDLGSKAAVGEKKVESSLFRPDDFFSQLFGAFGAKKNKNN